MSRSHTQAGGGNSRVIHQSVIEQTETQLLIADSAVEDVLRDGVDRFCEQRQVTVPAMLRSASCRDVACFNAVQQALLDLDLIESLVHVETQDDAELKQIKAWIFASASLPHFAGHFPGQPLLPGILQIHWAAQLTRTQFTLQKEAQSVQAVQKFTGLSRFKFQQSIEPNQVLCIEIDEKLPKHADSGVANFGVRVRTYKGVCTTGTLQYER